jgi:hypothetical protein
MPRVFSHCPGLNRVPKHIDPNFVRVTFTVKTLPLAYPDNNIRDSKTTTRFEDAKRFLSDEEGVASQVDWAWAANVPNHTPANSTKMTVVNRS